MFNGKIFGFVKQLNVGNGGEDLFIQSYSDLNPKKGDGRITDIILGDGKTIELKTDSYCMDKTPNIFIEHFGNREKKTLGGPWRAQKDKIDYFVYLYIKQKTFFWFKPIELINRVEHLYSIDKVEVKYIKNIKYETMGYLVDRKWIEDIIFRVDCFGDGPF